MALQGIQDKLGMSGRSAHVDRRLDNAVEDSFPASDPVQLAQPHDPEEMGVRSRLSSTHWWLLGGGLLTVLAIIALRR